MAVVGVFDSGVGGLTVLRDLLPRLPGAEFHYLGDTARLPYGSKSQAAVTRFAVESARLLESRGCDHLVIACNTATALALDAVRAAVRMQVIGVIDPVVQATRQQSAGAEVLVLATAATVESHAYREQFGHAGIRATEKACPLLASLVEEGWTDHPVTRDVLRIYLGEALRVCRPQAVVLGCTHYPLLARAIGDTLQELGSPAEVVDSAQATALAVARSLPSTGIGSSPATLRCYATDSVEKFARLGSLFLGQPVGTVELVDLGG